MSIKFSKKLSDKIIKEGMQKEVFTHINKINLVSTIIKYVIDSRFRKGYNLRIWIVSQMNNPRLKKIVEQQGWTKLKNDLTVYEAQEYWATVDEILDKKTDDCDGFSNIIYHSALLAGIPDYRLFKVAGSVVGGGHAYCVYRANNGLEYPIDGCYWTNISIRMTIPYSMRKEYFNGESEWFRFNSDGMYVRRSRK